jgi:biotin carboxyl carrier protein
MYKVKVNGEKEFSIEFNDKERKEGKLEDTDFIWDLLKVKDDSYHVIKGDKSYNIEVVKADFVEKSFTLKINGNKYTTVVRDRFDELLKKLGMEALGAKINEIKAPMPGLVLDIIVSAGTEVKKGDPVIVLEAMKMENILKSPADGIVKKVNVEVRQAVEKNQVLLVFE